MFLPDAPSSLQFGYLTSAQNPLSSEHHILLFFTSHGHMREGAEREGERKREGERQREGENEKEKQFTTLHWSEPDGIHPDTHDMAIDYLIRKALVCFHACDTH